MCKSYTAFVFFKIITYKGVLMKKITVVLCAFGMFVGTISAAEKQLTSASSRTWKSAVVETACGGLGVVAAYTACDRGGIAPVVLCAASAAVLANSMTTKDALKNAAFIGTMVFVVPKVLGMSDLEDESIKMLTFLLAVGAAPALAQKGIDAACEYRDNCIKDSTQSDDQQD